MILIKANKNFFEEVTFEMVRFYRENPVLAALDLLQVDLHPVQQIILEDCWKRKYTTTVACRGTGKTYIAGGVIAPLFAILYPGTRIGFISSSFRQARFLFEKAEETYLKSSIFRQACKGEPKRNPDSFRIDLKPVGGIPPGKLEAIPIGTDGAKIRGARYGILAIDEFAQVPKSIFDKVISPMASTKLDPMTSMRAIQKIDRQFKAGLLSQEQYENYMSELSGSVNRIFTFSSAYYQFNHLYEQFEKQRKLIKEGDSRYAIHQVSYREIPKGFLEEDGIENARRTLSSSDFMMEYEGEFVPDSEGVFKASLIESRRNGMANNVWDKTIKTSSPGPCVMGIDPARSHDYCAIVIIELGNPHQVIYAWNHRGMDFPSMSKKIHKLAYEFNVAEIYMDKFGGGQAIADILATLEPPLADKEDDLRIGKKIITLVHPSNIETNRAVNDSKSLLEQGKLWFPASPSAVENSSTEKENIYDTVQLMISQLTSIVATSTASGQVHFDVPGGTKDKNGIKKDLFSAFVLAGKACFDVTERPKEEINLLYPYGFIRARY